MWRATLTGSAKQRSRLEKKLDRRPNDRKTVGELGDLLYDLGQYDDAVPIFERGVELGNESRRMRLRFARLHVALHRIHEAGATPTVEPWLHLSQSLEHYQHVLKSSETMHMPAVLMEVALVHYRLNHHQACATLCAHHLAQFPSSPLTPMVTVLAAHVLVRAGQYKEAAIYYAELLLNPPPCQLQMGRHVLAGALPNGPYDNEVDGDDRAPDFDLTLDREEYDAILLFSPPPHRWGVHMEIGLVRLDPPPHHPATPPSHHPATLPPCQPTNPPTHQPRYTSRWGRASWRRRPTAR